VHPRNAPEIAIRRLSVAAGGEAVPFFSLDWRIAPRVPSMQPGRGRVTLTRTQQNECNGDAIGACELGGHKDEETD